MSPPEEACPEWAEDPEFFGSLTVGAVKRCFGGRRVLDGLDTEEIWRGSSN